MYDNSSIVAHLLSYKPEFCHTFNRSCLETQVFIPVKPFGHLTCYWTSIILNLTLGGGPLIPSTKSLKNASLKFGSCPPHPCFCVLFCFYIFVWPTFKWLRFFMWRSNLRRRTMTTASFTFTETELNRSACIGKLDCFRASAGTPPAS